MSNKQITVTDIMDKKKTKIPITMLTAYDYPTALLVDKAGIDIILVGDSLAMVVLGYQDTVSISIEEMLHHIKAVTRVAKNSFVIGDMPFGSYNISVKDAVANAVRFMKEGRVSGVKLEGGQEMALTIEAIVKAGIPVQGHIGLTPQTIAALGGFKVQGKSAEAAKKLIQDAKALENAGCFSIVLEAIPAEISKKITESISIPTIGIGAGADCDGQVLVLHDMIGLFDRFTPKFVKRYASISKTISDAIKEYKKDVENKKFPQAQHSFSISDEELKKL
ncbi:MAG: 3-methyl-2-oxobutanoate hydroxymethyltransferase [Deltaproteobacteria bacterium]|nr:3-methyl-2-oxobutanoate hydroxymethyltransferase [Deltaproteobacteria bacterium]